MACRERQVLIERTKFIYMRGWPGKGTVHEALLLLTLLVIKSGELMESMERFSFS
jgi:hypothetical protein